MLVKVWRNGSFMNFWWGYKWVQLNVERNFALSFRILSVHSIWPINSISRSLSYRNIYVSMKGYILGYSWKHYLLKNHSSSFLLQEFAVSSRNIFFCYLSWVFSFRLLKMSSDPWLSIHVIFNHPLIFKTKVVGRLPENSVHIGWAY